MCVGGAKGTLAEAATYANGRRQFGQPIASFGAIKFKLAEMALKIYAVESMLYRTTGLIDGQLAGSHDGPAVPKVLEEFAIEASLLKVSGSEMADFLVDENVQIHGGNGFVADYPAERRYRDARVNRIFEGTNEINRLLVPGMLIKRGLKGGLPLIQAAKAVRDELMSVTPSLDTADNEPLGAERRTSSALRKTVLVALGLAMETWRETVEQEQEALMALTDLMIDAFAAESAVMRASQAVAASHPDKDLHIDAATVITYDAALHAEVVARTLLASMLEGDALRTALAGLRRLLKVPAVNTIAPRRRIAEVVSAKRAYPFAR
jgi:hypothetical protein